jgi:MFS family permease
VTTNTVAPPAPDADARQRRVLRLLIALQLVSMTGRGVFYAVSALYFTQVVGLSVPGVGLALSVAAGAGVLATFATGHVADHLPARHLIAVAVGIECAALLALPRASSLAAFGLLAGVESAMNRGCATARQTLLARSFTGPERTPARARMRVATNLGIGLGSAAAALVLADGRPEAFRLAMTLAALAYAVAVVLALRIPVDRVRREPDAPDAEPRRRPWRDRRYLALTCVNGAVVTHFAVVEVGLPIWLVTRTSAPPVLVSLLLLLNTALVVFLQVPLNRGFEQPRRAGGGFLLGGILLGLAMAAYAGAVLGGPVVAAAVLVAGGVAHGIGEVLTSGAGFSLSFELADERAPGSYQGFYGTGQAIGMMLGPVLVTTALGIGPAGWLAFAAAYVLLGGAGWAMVRHP